MRQLIFGCWNVHTAWELNSAATFCSQPHKQASAHGHNDNNNDKAQAVAAGCEAKVVAELLVN